METNVAQNVGVDISKATLDVYLHPAGIARQFANDSKGIIALLGWLVDHLIVRVVFEPTGRYHHAFEQQLDTAGLSLAKVNPRQARRFAEAIGCSAKTGTRTPPCWRGWAHSLSHHPDQFQASFSTA